MKKVAEEIRGIGVLVQPGFKDMRDLLTSGNAWIDLLRAL